MAVAVASISLVVALVALVMVRRQARQLRRLTEMYWQLKYDHGELRATVSPGPETPAPSPPATAFVPLGAVKRSSS